ncbi:DUF4352 domain-containing protein [Nocardiopsis changdeensis]|uniref:DUF4352 domain-containing protein n=1 Tax=Nocardiopsis changdeensis TaxID=2831969 RepID=UPI003F468AF7
MPPADQQAPRPGPQPYVPPVPPPPHRPTGPANRRGIVVIAAAAAVLLVLALLAVLYVVTNLGGDDAPSGQQTQQPGTSAAPEDGGEGGPGEGDGPATPGTGAMEATSADGLARVKVLDVECDQTTIPSREVQVQANGHYCVLDVDFTNLSDAPVLLDHEAQGVRTELQQEVVADRPSRIEEQESLWEAVQPGETATGIMVFTLHVGEYPEALVFRHDRFAEPVEVLLKSAD